MDTETEIKVRALIADAKARIPALKEEIARAEAAGVPTAGMRESLAAAEQQIALLEQGYGAS